MCSTKSTKCVLMGNFNTELRNHVFGWFQRWWVNIYWSMDIDDRIWKRFATSEFHGCKWCFPQNIIQDMPYRLTICISFLCWLMPLIRGAQSVPFSTWSRVVLCFLDATTKLALYHVECRCYLAINSTTSLPTSWSEWSYESPIKLILMVIYCILVYTYNCTSNLYSILTLNLIAPVDHWDSLSKILSMEEIPNNRLGWC